MSSKPTVLSACQRAWNVRKAFYTDEKQQDWLAGARHALRNIWPGGVWWKRRLRRRCDFSTLHEGSTKTNKQARLPHTTAVLHGAKPRHRQRPTAAHACNRQQSSYDVTASRHTQQQHCDTTARRPSLCVWLHPPANEIRRSTRSLHKCKPFV